MSATLPVAVIGGGLAGLASACTLAARGWPVTLFEKNGWFGGKAAVLEQDGFRFDMGPTILTVPEVLRRVFDEAGVDMDERLDLRRLDPQWRCFFEDGLVLDLEENIEAMAARLEALSPGDGDGYRRLIEMSRGLHEVSENFFFWKSVGGLRDTVDLRANMDLSTLRQVLSLRMGSNVAREIRRRVADPRASQMLDHMTQYVGSSPALSPAVLCSIAHMQAQGGVWYPMGGTRAVPDALIRLAGELGVRLQAGVDVTRIVERDGRVRAVETACGEQIKVSAVVSNMDSVRTMRELVGGEPAAAFARRWKSKRPACSGVVLYLGLDRGYEHLLHHDFLFSHDPEQEFEDIYRAGIPAADPTCYLAAPARTDPSVAPPGGEALYVLAHTPFIRRGQDWEKMFPAYRRTILEKLKRCGGMPDIEDRIVTEAHLTPQDIHDRYRVLRGAIYGLASHGAFTGAFKPANRSRELAGLYLAGGAAHPGPGMPMVLMSGWIAADCLDRDLGDGSAARASGGARCGVVRA